MTEKPVEQKSFELLLASASDKVREKYLDFLEDARREGSASVKGHTYFVPYSERESLLKQAEASVFHGVDTRKMRKAWELAGGDANPPLKGAVDD